MRHRKLHLSIATCLAITSVHAYADSDPLIPGDSGSFTPPTFLGDSSSTNRAIPTNTQPAPAPPQATPAASTPQTFESYFSAGNEAMRNNNIEGAIGHYRNAIAREGRFAEPYFNLGLAELQQKNYAEAVAALGEATTRNPSFLKAHIYRGKAFKELGQIDNALEHYKQAIALDPNNGESHAEIGRLLCRQEKFNDAEHHLVRAHQLRPNDIPLAFECANTLNTINKLEPSLAIYKELLEKVPSGVGIWYNIAYTLKRLNRLEESLKYYDKVIELSPDHGEAHFSKGLAHLMLGDWENGWKGYDWRWSRSKVKPVALQVVQQPTWDGKSDINGKRVLVHCEQGYGDTFQFIRYAKLLKERGATVLVSPQPGLDKLLAHCPYIDRLVDLHQPLPQFDTHVLLVSLPNLLGTTLENVPCDVPYLAANPYLQKEWATKLEKDTNFKIGICWQGNNNYQTAFLRAVVSARPIDLKLLAPLGQVPNVSIYSLQQMDGTEQLSELPPGFIVKTFGENFDRQSGRFMDTAAVMKNLDLIISVDTSIAHLAGGLGMPTWVLIPDPPDWRWMFDRPTSPWYPNVRLFRQTTSGDWPSVVARIAQELHQTVSTWRSRKG